MDPLVAALAPAFAVGFATQRLIEIVDAALDGLVPKILPKHKKLWLAVAAVVIGVAAATYAGIRVLRPLGVTANDAVDIVVTSLVVSGGTEGLNSIMKFLLYKKEEQKDETAALKGTTPETARALMP